MSDDETAVDKGSKLAAEIFASTVVPITDTWRKVFEVRTSTKLPQGAVDQMVLESLIFGRYYVEAFLDEDDKAVKKAIGDTINFYLSELYFESTLKDSEPDKHASQISELFSKYYAGRKKEYASYEGGDIIELFKARLQLIFSEGRYDLAFMYMTLKKKLQVKLAFFLDAIGGHNSLSVKKVYDVAVLNALADDIAASVAAIEVRLT